MIEARSILLEFDNISEQVQKLEKKVRRSRDPNPKCLREIDHLYDQRIRTRSVLRRYIKRDTSTEVSKVDAIRALRAYGEAMAAARTNLSQFGA